jgi:uncharacterized protein
VRLTLLFLLASLAFPLDLSRLQPQGPVSDFANVVDSAAESSINAYLLAVEKATGAQIALVTIDTLDGELIEDTANKLYRQWGVGAKASNEGALFLFAIKERKSRLEVGYGLEPVIPDGAAGTLLRAMRPALREGNYGTAFIEAARNLGGRVAQSKNVTIQEQLPARPIAREIHRDEIESWLPIAAFIVIALILVANNRSGRSGYRRGGTWIYPGTFGGGGFGGSSGGSFGGSSWGGFGGGSSGGGGASSDW